MMDKIECPNCGEKTLERVWCATIPQTCPICLHQEKQFEVTC